MRRAANAFLFGGVAIVALVTACGGESMSSEGGSGGTAGSSGGASSGTGGVTGGAGGTGGGTSGTGGATGGTVASGGTGGSMSGAAGMSGSGGRCPNGIEVEIDRLCVRGIPSEDGELIASFPFRIELYPRGCFSSSCTTILDASCTVTVSGDELLVDGAICHAPPRTGDAVPCTDDCGGGGIAECTVGPLVAQTYFAIYEDLIVAFEVSSVVEPGGRCVSRVTDGPPPRNRLPAQSPVPSKP